MGLGRCRQRVGNERKMKRKAEVFLEHTVPKAIANPFASVCVSVCVCVKYVLVVL